jgi:hypothetical protein
MSKYCYSGYDFQAQANEIIKAIAKEQKTLDDYEQRKLVALVQMKKYKNELKKLGHKGNCEVCEFKLECITNNKENINVKTNDGW